LLVGTRANADLPVGIRTNRGTPAELQCYALDDFKKLLKLDADVTACASETALLNARISFQAQGLEASMRALQAQQEATTLLRVEATRLFQNWQDELKLRQETETRLQAGKWAGWVAAGALAVSTGILTIVVIVRK
jgi:hypothetical protein